MGKITNKAYRQFLDEGIIETLGESDIKKALSNIKGKNVKEGRALLIALYYTGARPNEVLDIKSKDVQKKKSYVLIKVKGSKRGLPRTIYLQYRRPLVKEFYKYACSIFPGMYLFHNFIGHYERTYINKEGEIKTRIDTTDKLRYHVKKWFQGVVKGSITPYFLRHNRFSKLAEKDVRLQDIRMLKGSRTTDSIKYYLHLSSRSAKKIARKMD